MKAYEKMTDEEKELIRKWEATKRPGLIGWLVFLFVMFLLFHSAVKV